MSIAGLIRSAGERALRISAAWGDTAYAGASRVRKQLDNWFPMRTTADAELLTDQDMLVARSRDLDRNNGIAAGAFQSLNDNVVGGMGMRLAATPDYRALGRDINWAEQWSRTVESLWKTWAESTACDAAGKMNFISMTQLVFRSALASGEALALPLWLERQDTPFRTCLQLVEADRLSNPASSLPTMFLRGGVELDIYGKPIAYHIRQITNWTGMLLPMYSGFSGLAGDWIRIPAETSFGRKRVLHMFAPDRVDQTRGKPILAPIIEQFRMLDSYQRTELQSAIVNSIVAGIIETPLDPAGINELMGGDPNAYLATKGNYNIQLQGGTFIPLYPGDKMTPFTPSRPAPQYANFVESVMRQIGVAIGLPYELVLKDFSKTNYSSARAALMEAWRFFLARRSWLASYWCAPVYKLWLEEAINAGMVEAPGFNDDKLTASYYLRTKWIGPGRGWIDPVKEAQASQIRMDSLISTLEDECAEQGLDWNDVLEQRAIEQKRIAELGIVIPLIPGPPKGEKEVGGGGAPEEAPGGGAPPAAGQEAA